jgi:glycosyltransferase involved in cell wall biosynthesis
MRILIVTPEPASALKPRVFRFAKLLSTAHVVHIAYIDEIQGRQVPTDIRVDGQNQLQEVGIETHQLRACWPLAIVPLLANYMRGLPLRVGLYAQGKIRSQVEQLVGKVRPDLIHVDRERAFPVVCHLRIPLVVDLTDPVGWYLEQRSRLTHPLLSELLRIEARRMWLYEGHIAKQVREIFFASEFGASRFKDRYPGAKVGVIPVPLPPPATAASSSPLLPGGPPHICFFGNLYYPPNVQAITDFVKNCWPEVRARLPTATLHVAGSRPHSAITKLQRREGVYVHSNPVEMGSLLRGCDVAVAPLEVCAGFPNKIVDAVITGGLPVVASSAAQAGLPPAARDTLPTASEPREWAEKISILWQRKDLRQDLVNKMRDALTSTLNNELILSQLNTTYNCALSS